VPNGDDQTVYLVVDDFGSKGRAWRAIPETTGGVQVTSRVLNVVKAPVGWVLFLDRVRLGGVHGTKEEALEAAAVAAAFVVRDGDGVQINVPDEASETETGWPRKWDAFLKRKRE
jgi:hypothetical protein